MSDYVSGLRQDLVEAAARQQAAGRGARVARPLRPRAWSPVVVLGAAAALVAALVLVVGLRAVTPPRPPEAPKVVGGFHIEVQPSDAVAAGGYVIVSDDGGQLLQIDPRTEEQHQITPQRRRSGGACRGRRHRVGRDREHRPGSPALDPGPTRSGERPAARRRPAGGRGPLARDRRGRPLGPDRANHAAHAPGQPGADRPADPPAHRGRRAARVGEPRRFGRFGLDAQPRDGDPARRPRPGRQPRAAHLARHRLRWAAVDRRGRRRRVGRRPVRRAALPDRERTRRQADPHRSARRRDRAHALGRVGDHAGRPRPLCARARGSRRRNRDRARSDRQRAAPDDRPGRQADLGDHRKR